MEISKIYLCIFFGITVCVVPAHGVTKCIKLNSSTQCVPRGISSNTIDITFDCNDMRVTIIGACSSTVGTTMGQVTSSALSTSYTDADNKYCWCKMISPAVSKWVYYNVVGGCATGCTFECASALPFYSEFSSALFSDLE